MTRRKCFTESTLPLSLHRYAILSPSRVLIKIYRSPGFVKHRTEVKEESLLHLVYDPYSPLMGALLGTTSLANRHFCHFLPSISMGKGFGTAATVRQRVVEPAARQQKVCRGLPTVRSYQKTTWQNHTLLSRKLQRSVCLFVDWLLNVPATGECISGTDLPRQCYVLPH